MGDSESDSTTGWLRNFLSDPLKLIGSILGIISVTIGIILGVPKVVALISPPFKPDRSVLLLVDTSHAMNRRFGKTPTKYRSVASQIVRHLRHEPGVVFALRFSGGKCSEEYQDPTVTFGEGKHNEIEQQLETESPRGKADFIAALEDGATDFTRFDLAKSAKIQSIWAFIGSASDSCGDLSSIRGIKHALSGYRGNVIFDFYSLGLSQTAKKKMHRLRQALDKLDYAEAYVFAPKDTRELGQDLDNSSLRETPSE